MAHDTPVVNGDGSHAGAEVDEGDAVLHVVGAEDGTGDDVRQEVFLGDGDPKVVEDLVDGHRVAAAADEDSEITFEAR